MDNVNDEKKRKKVEEETRRRGRIFGDPLVELY